MGGPIEILWSDNEATLLDVRSDWTLEVVPRRWCDPYSAATAADRRDLDRTVGIWLTYEVEGSDPFVALLGQRAASAETETNAVRELSGITIDFGESALSASAYGGHLYGRIIQAT